MNLRTASRALALAAITSTFAMGCAAETEEDQETDEAAIVDVPNSPVERQAIGNCWIYANASWVESMSLAAGRPFDISQSYWTYWHIMDKVRGGATNIDDGELGGSYRRANALAERYGVIDEKSFIPEDTRSTRSKRQSEAVEKINASLRPGGALRAAVASGNGAAIRKALDDAWGLGAKQRRWLDRAFGVAGRGTFTGGGGSNAGTPIIRASEFTVQYTNGGRPVKTSLSNAIAQWNEVSGSGDRAFLKRVQRALHDAQPVYITWRVNSRALAPDGSFNLATYRARGGGGTTGIHMTVMEDYEAVLADGTVLPANKIASPAQLTRALADSTKISFFRIKNSWGTGAGSSVPFVAGMGGYNDLALDYLTANIGGGRALISVVLPPGY